MADPGGPGAPPPAAPRVGETVIGQRVRVGAIGLAAVFLLVMLATALLHVAGAGDLGNSGNSAGAHAAEPAEPLAQLGVAPGNAPNQPVDQTVHPHPVSAAH